MDFIVALFIYLVIFVRRNALDFKYKYVCIQAVKVILVNHVVIAVIITFALY